MTAVTTTTQQKTVPNPYTGPVNPWTFYKVVPTKDPLGFIRVDNGAASPLAISSAQLYSHSGGPNGNGFVHDGLTNLLRGGSFGEGSMPSSTNSAAR